MNELASALLEEIKSSDVPSGYSREGIIIPPTYYAVMEKKSTVLGKEVTKTEIEKTTDLPEGFIFSPDYVPRLYIKSGKVVAIEILKKA